MAWANSTKLTFRNYKARDKTACLNLFDENCPEYFAPNERMDFEKFLDSSPRDYQVCMKGGIIIGVFGVFKKAPRQSRLEWILISHNAQGVGLGTIIMEKARSLAYELDADVIHIATSHKAYKFFEKKGADKLSETKNGWGPDMHRIDMALYI